MIGGMPNAGDSIPTVMERNEDLERIDETAERQIDEGPERRAPSRWHRTSSLSDGTPIGRLGAYWYVLDRDDRTISDGYHELYLDESGHYRGRRNARTERIVLHTEPTRSTR